MSPKTIFVAVPAFEGKEFLPETLRSIRDQTFTNYRVLISIDNNDIESAEVCKEFLADQRFNMIIQPEHLGWPGNLNWLIDQCDCTFFMYWQQDDLASTNYLEELLKVHITYKSASITYTDVQWFGSKFERDSCPSILGNATQRLGRAIEQISYIPLRGLIRTSVLKLADHIPSLDKYSSHIEFHFLVELAALGEFRRSEKAMYFKRAHNRNTFNTWTNWQPWQKRRSWIEMGLDFLKVSKKYLQDEFLESAIVFIIDRLAIPRKGRGFFYVPPSDGIHEFVRDFLILGNLSNPLNRINELFLNELNSFEKPINVELKKALERTERLDKLKLDLRNELEINSEVIVEIKKGSNGISLLGYGWYIPEPWGVWTDGKDAAIMLPLEKSGIYELHLDGYHYIMESTEATKKACLSWRVLTNRPFQEIEVIPGIDTTVILKFEYQNIVSNFPCKVDLHLPDSVFLPDDGIPDHRRVGFGLKRLKIVKILEV